MSGMGDSGVEVLGPSDCWAMLRTVDVGRLAVVVDGAPDIFPVNFVVDHGTVVFRPAPGTKLGAARQGAAGGWGAPARRGGRGTGHLSGQLRRGPWHGRVPHSPRHQARRRPAGGGGGL